MEAAFASRAASISGGRPVAGGHTTSHAPSGPPRVLIVEDEFLVAMLIDDMVRDLGYAVSAWAPDIQSARQELSKKNFDVVFLDISLDGERCLEIADALLEMAMPFAFVSGYQQTFEERHAPVPLLLKPFMPDQVRALLEQLVGPGDGTLDEMADVS